MLTTYHNTRHKVPNCSHSIKIRHKSDLHDLCKLFNIGEYLISYFSLKKDLCWLCHDIELFSPNKVHTANSQYRNSLCTSFPLLNIEKSDPFSTNRLGSGDRRFCLSVWEIYLSNFLHVVINGNKLLEDYCHLCSLSLSPLIFHKFFLSLFINCITIYGQAPESFINQNFSWNF